MKLLWIEEGWEDYLYWQKTDKKMVKKVNQLIREVMLDSFQGTGKPEPLKYNLSGWWSRRITIEHRLVYRVEKDKVVILSCRRHY